MNVYVESNFILEQALEQEQSESCEKLVQIASAGSVRLAIPAFSLAESHIALLRKGNERKRLSADLQNHLHQLGRSRPYREAVGSFREFAEILIKSVEHERTRLGRIIEALLQTAEVIPLDAEMFNRADSIQRMLDMSTQDSIVLASVILHLQQTNPPASCFLNRNTEDFDDPAVREMLEGDLRCKFIGRFDHGLSYVTANLGSQEQ